VLLVVACGHDEEEAPETHELTCLPSSFALKKLALPEASGAVWGKTHLGEGWLVVADHGNEGALSLVSASGEVVTSLELPLDESAGDDLEGLAWSTADRLVGLTSSGYVRQWSLHSETVQLTHLAVAFSDDPEWTCAAYETNCGPNWEGLCLDPAPLDAGCAGFAVSKKKGDLVCLRTDGSGFVLDPTVRIDVSGKNELSGCDYTLTPPHALLVSGNDESDNRLWEIIDHRSPAMASARALEIGGTLNQEAIAFGPDGVLLSFGDEEALTGEGSAIAAFYCQ